MTTLLRRPPHNLPVAMSSFVGRENEIAAVAQWLAETRLLTLTGPGGCGKTRLALQVAGKLLAEFQGHVWLSELAPIADPTLVARVVAAALGVHEQPGLTLIETLAGQLANRKALLIFDNCEHLVRACAQLAEALLQACPHLRILATSRETLNLAGERVWLVPPLSLPDPQPWRSPASAGAAQSSYQQSEAMRLFVTRATAVAPDFKLSEQNAGWVANICRRLDGLPLAIELAAARVRAMSVSQIAERLDDRFRLLTGGSRTAAPRHQTLGAALDWSYTLLPEAEQKALQRLSVFAGGCTLPAAEAVCAGEDLPQAAVLDLLAHLVEKSLVTTDQPPAGEMRYGLLETIRAYARERLLATEAATATRRRHALFFLALAQQGTRADSNLNWPEQLTTVNLLEAERDNLRAALAWSQAEPDSEETGLRLAAALAQFWQMRGYVTEGLAWLEAFLAAHPGASKAARAEALFLTGYLHIYSDQIQRGQPFLQEALGLYQELNDTKGMAWQKVWLGWMAVARGDYAQATALGEQAFAVLQALGDKHGAGVALVPKAEAAYRQGDFALAKAVLEVGLPLYREIGNHWVIGRRSARLAQIAYRLGDTARAQALLHDSITACADAGDYAGTAQALTAAADLAHAQGASERAVCLLGAVAALQESTGAPLWFVDRMESERIRVALRAQLGASVFDERWNEGRALALAQAVAYALEPLPARQTELPDSASARDFAGLTRREREVVALIAQGKSNRQIAEVMVVRARTVETYVTRILSKLDLDSRVQVATWAIAHGYINT